MPRFHVDGKVVEGVDLLKRRGTAWRLDVWPFIILYSAWIFTIVPSLDFTDASIVLGCLSAVHILTLLFTAWSVDFRCFVQFKKAKDIHDAEACKITPAKFSGTKEIVPLLKRRAVELCRGLEAVLGSSFGSDPFVPPPNPLIIVISGPSGVGKDAVIKGLREVREGIHFVVTATSRAKRPGEVEGKDYYFVAKEEFLSMIERDELLEYALVYGEYKGIPKQQIRDFMAKGYDIVLRVDVQGAATLRSILGKSAIFIFLVAESEEALVKRLIDRKTETTESLLVRVATAREEVKHLKEFDYVVVNAEGKLDNAVDLMESIIDAEKARVRQRFVKI